MRTIRVVSLLVALVSSVGLAQGVPRPVAQCASCSLSVGSLTLSTLTLSGAATLAKGQKVILDGATGKTYVLADSSTDAAKVFSGVADGASAVAFIFDTSNAITDGSATLVSGRDNGTEMWAVNRWGQGTFKGGLQTSAGNSTYSDGYNFLTSSAGIYTGTGTPEGAKTAAAGSIFLRTDGPDPGTSFYVKESGSGNTGWVAK